MYSLYIRISMNPIDWFDSPLGADAGKNKKKVPNCYIPCRKNVRGEGAKDKSNV